MPNRRSSFLLYSVISLVLFPVSLLGYALWIAKMFWAGRHSRVSRTAQGPLSARWFQHQLGVRPDEASHRLMRVLPGISPLALWLVFGPTLLAYRLSGYLPKTFRYPYEGEPAATDEAAARQTFFDSAVDRFAGDVTQFVSLGAGFDTRAFRLAPGVRAFEVDTPQTQAVKREMLRQAGIDASRITFAPADFEREDWLKRLEAAGFDPRQPALFLWEGVCMYLDRAAVEDTLRKIAGTAPGSLLAFDYITREPLEGSSLYWRYARAATRAAGEPFQFGVDSRPPSRDRLAELLASCGLDLLEQRTLGQESASQRAWGGFAVAVVRV